mmetsp:Transcript_16789/g.25375  ORF Transcript_16789/g.25375 Transcript_16789/m.25375 type:complete len:286 (-) Transcript_16789:215-1072(-)|eukprot:CAMPEP_0178901226 /NCGR_PEP_ID=MMETSP0786-20121207/3905_1 /TAXON_ID=186022 /ORGANISM="Thalassionema frauenfeldii, Strain CCMP 1798" /LENGTH=285 /DNA_ID=CAMNT_0020572305 /DNA_START=25 /DNA_END=882 /DNA_ORIENTATION=-
MTPTFRNQIDTIPKELKQRRRFKKRYVNDGKDVDTVSLSSSSYDSSLSGSPKKDGGQRQFDTAHSLKDEDRYVALDCEMVGVGESGHQSSLARVCIVNWYGETMLDLYVRQRDAVTDYRTYWSGIRAEHLTSKDAVDFDECRTRVSEILRGKIIVGHALKNDLSALEISHPWYQMRDTAKYEPFMKVRFNDGILWPRKLKDLAIEKLGLQIQPNGRSHCPLEDANTALSLYKEYRGHWEQVMDYKLKRTREIEERKMLSDVLSRIDHLDSIFNNRMQRVCLKSHR